MRKREKRKAKIMKKLREKRKGNNLQQKVQKRESSKKWRPKFWGRNANFHENRTPDFTQLAPNFTCKH
jgi:hypothetical protein